jgi:integrase
MARATITRVLIRALPPLPDGVAKRRIFDNRLKGFIAEQRRSGTTLYFRYCDERGRNHELKLGREGDVTVEQARKRAEQLRAEVSLGGDPIAERDQRLAVPLFEAFVRERYLPHVRERLRSSGNVEAYCRRFLPVLGRKALDEITVTDIAALRRRLIDEGLSPASVNRHLATLRSLFNLARKWELVRTANPASSPGMLPERQRDRYLTPEQTRALVAALDREPSRDAAAALVLLVLTGARKRELLHARWAGVDLGRGLLTVPRAKSGRTRHIPLSPAAVRVLRLQQPRARPENPFVFPGRLPGRSLENLRGTWERAKRAAALPADLRIHDLRHSFASVLANSGTPINEIGVVLGHRQLATTTRYTHHAPHRLVEMAAVAGRVWNLLPETEGSDA